MQGPLSDDHIKRIYSHPQALAQCDRFLRTLSGVEITATYDTAGSVRDPVEIQAARVSEAVRSKIDSEIEDLLDRARLFAEASPEPDPSGALDYLYSGALRGRGGTA